MGKKISDKKLASLVVSELIELVKQYRDGEIQDFGESLEKAKYWAMLKKRGLKFCFSRNFIHRIFTGEFDDLYGIEVSIQKKESK